VLVELNRNVARLGTEVDALRQELDSLRAGGAEAQSAGDSTRTVAGQVGAIREGVGGLVVPILLSIVVILIMFYVIKAIVWILEVSSEQNATRRLLFKRMIPVVRVVLWSIAIYIILANVFNVSASQLLTASAALGVAIGFAAQDVLKNIFGGILILLDKPFQVGDKINVGGTYGEVVSIGLRSTRITTPDDNLVSVPNAQVVDGQVANANAGALDCQVVTDLYLPGWVDVSKAKSIAYNAAANSEYVFLDKPIVVLVKDEFKETFLTHLLVKAYVIDARYETRFASDVTEMAKVEFLREGMLQPIYGLDALGQRIQTEANDNGTEAQG
jgi:small-conductance mechanosensitive channel